MTIYEIIATVIAAIALIQPWFIFLYKKFFKKIHVSFLPSSTIKLFYNKSGSYVSLGGVIESKNQSCIVNNISAKVVRLSDKAELKTTWSTFSSPIFQFVAGNSVTSSETARPFKIESNGLCPVFVEFENSDNETNNRLKEIFDEIKNKTDEIVKQPKDIDSAKKELKNYSKYNKYEKELLENYYWKEGNYVLYYTITYNEKFTLTYQYTFSISRKEVEKLKENINKALDSELYFCYRQAIPFYSCQKDFIEYTNNK
jgi:hypothetical protein